MSEVNQKINLAIANIGVEPSTAIELSNAFAPFLVQAAEWKEKAEALVVTDVSQVKEMADAREARLALQKVRTSADKKRKELKEESLRYGKAVQDVYNLIEGTIKPIEEHLHLQEKFAEIQRQKEVDTITLKRNKELLPFAEFVAVNLDLGNMSESDYQNVLKGAMMLTEIKAKEAAEAEAKRIEAEAEAKEERERIQKENERLRNEAKEREALLAEERMKREAIEAEQKAAEEAERQRKDQERKEAERQAEAQRQAEQKAKAAPDNMKIIRWIADMEELPSPEVSSPEALAAIASIQGKLKEIRLALPG